MYTKILIGLFLIWNCSFIFTQCKPIASSSVSDFFDQTKDVINGERTVNFKIGSNGVNVSVGPSEEEIAAYICIGLGILLIGVCCCCCIKNCCCTPERPPTTIIYQQMAKPGHTTAALNNANAVNMYDRSISSGAWTGTGVVNFDPMPSVGEISKQQRPAPPAYSHTNCTTNIPL